MAGDEGDDNSELINEEIDLDISDHPGGFLELEELLSAQDLDPNLVNDVVPMVEVDREI